jgi:MFS family permease
MSVIEARSTAEPAAPSRQSLLALSFLNFFLSGMQTAFGPIASAYLVLQGWTAKEIGFVLTIGGIASLVSQVPGGELVDTVRAKRLLVATDVVTVALSVVIFRLWPNLPLVALAEIFQAATGGVLGPAVVAITLGLVGQTRLSERLGQNQRFAAAGGVAVTLTIALFAYSDSPWAMLVPAALAVPVLISLNHIRAEEIDFARASGAAPADADRPERASRAALLKNRRLLIFAACAALFQLASASMMPLLGGVLAYEGKRQAAPLIAALLVVPQLLVGLLAPWVGRSAEKHGASRCCSSGSPLYPSVQCSLR